LQCWEEPPVGDNIISNDTVTMNTNDEHHDINGTLPQQKVERYIFINNVGSLGHIGSCATYGATTVHDMHHTMTLNVTNSLWFTTRIVQWFKQQQQRTSSGGRNNRTIVASPPNLKRQLTIVNVSSIVAIQSFPSLATYSAGKAARDMYHNALAKEEEEEEEQLDAIATNNHGEDDSNVTGHGGSIRVLNYAPGPLRTDMTTQLQNHASALHPSIRSFYEETCRNQHRDKNTNDEEASSSLIDPADSANVLLKLLWKDDYTNGAHVDYYDCQ
jgi:NAD(P)-dependent dehydrogenase (short-subunit alcohol dehydrogenase family)